MLRSCLALAIAVVMAATAFAAETRPAAPAGVAAAPSEFPITLDQLRALLARGETPRLRVVNRQGGTVTGRAVGVQSGNLQIDVSDEGLGVDGVFGLPTANVATLTALVPLTADRKKAARDASAAYLADLRAKIAAGKVAGPAPSAPAIESTSVVPAAVPTRGELPDEPLLDKYPPEEGWGPDKVEAITFQSIVLHLPPEGKDKTFLVDYDQWREAYDRMRQAQQDLEAKWKAEGKAAPADFSVLPELKPVPKLAGAPSPAPDAPVGNSSDETPTGMPTGGQ